MNNGKNQEYFQGSGKLVFQMKSCYDIKDTLQGMLRLLQGELYNVMRTAA